MFEFCVTNYRFVSAVCNSPSFNVIIVGKGITARGGEGTSRTKVCFKLEIN